MGKRKRQDSLDSLHEGNTKRRRNCVGEAESNQKSRVFSSKEIYDSAESLVHVLESQSWCLLELTPEQKRTVEECHSLVSEFFQRPLEFKKKFTYLSKQNGFQELQGFNVVSPQKQCFRVRGKAISYPSDEFRDACFKCRNLFHSLAFHLVRAICTMKDIDLNHLLQPHGLEVEKLKSFNPELHYDSPFDLFFYPNIDNEINCGEHVDPGFLTLIPVNTVGGLELFDRKIGKWFAPRLDANIGDLIVIVDVCFAQKISNWNSCIHRVQTNVDSRLSVCYELRPKIVIQE